jgi:hypothetical protein
MIAWDEIIARHVLSYTEAQTISSEDAERLESAMRIYS